jgi:hypothetical protein
MVGLILGGLLMSTASENRLFLGTFNLSQPSLEIDFKGALKNSAAAKINL